MPHSELLNLSELLKIHTDAKLSYRLFEMILGSQDKNLPVDTVHYSS